MHGLARLPSPATLALACFAGIQTAVHNVPDRSWARVEEVYVSHFGAQLPLSRANLEEPPSQAGFGLRRQETRWGPATQSSILSPKQQTNPFLTIKRPPRQQQAGPPRKKCMIGGPFSFSANTRGEKGKESYSNSSVPGFFISQKEFL